MPKRKAPARRRAPTSRAKAIAVKGLDSQANREAVAQALELVRQLAPTPPLHEPDQYMRIEAARSAYRAALLPLSDVLGGLAASIDPTMCVPLPCGQASFPNQSREPWWNLAECLDLCARCRGEALRALELLEHGLEHGAPPEPFLAPAIAAVRLQAAAQRRDAERRRDDEARRTGDLMLEQMFRRHGRTLVLPPTAPVAANAGAPPVPPSAGGVLSTQLANLVLALPDKARDVLREVVFLQEGGLTGKQLAKRVTTTSSNLVHGIRKALIPLGFGNRRDGSGYCILDPERQRDLRAIFEALKGDANTGDM